MHAIRTLLSYSLVIVILAAVVLAYYYRDRIMPEVDALYDEVQGWVNDKTAPPPAVSEQTPAESLPAGTAPPEVAVMEPPAESFGPVSGEAVMAGEESVAVESVPAEPALAGPTPPVPTEPSQTIATPEPAPEENNAMREPVPVEDIAGSTHHGMMTEASTPEPAPVVEPPAGAGTRDAGEPGQEQELLSQARQAYWQHNYDDAEAAYRQLLEINPDNPDWYGELGNLYYATGKWKLAGEAYYQAATRLWQTGRTAQLGYLLRVLKGLDPDLADKLEQEMQQVE